MTKNALFLLLLVGPSAFAQEPAPAPEAPPTTAPAKRKPMTWGERNVGEISGMGTWATGIALGTSSHAFASRYSFIGFSGEVMYHLKPWLSIGGQSGYQLFRDEGRETLEVEDAALNSYQFRYLDTAPILAVGRYYLDLGDSFTAFGALGLGTVYTNRVIDTGLVSVVNDGWHFGLSPQLGIMAHSNGPEVLLQVKYTWASGGEDLPSEMWFSAELGLLFD